MTATDTRPDTADLRPFPEERHGHAVVVAARPDDVPLGAGGLLHQWYEAGTSVEVVVAADDTPALAASLKALGMVDVDVHWLGVTEHRAELADRLTPLLADADVCLVPWPPDHHTVADVALAVAPVTAHRWSYPIPTWHRPADLPQHTAFVHRPAGPWPDGVEVFVRQPPAHTAPISRFAELYDDDDPWDVATKWYERRKRATLLAALPDERYGTAVEPACGTGILTRELAGRCDRVLASDPVPAAVRRCREHTADLPHVDVSVAALPGLPAERADLVVFSEILYYLGDDDLTDSVDGAVELLAPGGRLVAVHWLPWAAEAPRDGMAAHRFLLAHPGLDPLVEHVDERFVLHVLGRR